MENQPLPPSTHSTERPILSKTEINALFVSSLSDVYNMKTHLVRLIPELVKRASYQGLKQAILSTGLHLDAQLLRIDFIFKYLKYESNFRPKPLLGSLNVRDYLFSNVGELNTYQLDYIIINHLLTIEQLEIAQFKVLLTLAKGVYHKQIYSMIKLCLQDAIKEKRTFELLSKTYSL
ncbi:DUF892 family protein [Mucilaginibacter robiniae]|uniref:DUF892 family protein n=1 Tax=Mucilaginibacter robiniae TaxID=2728022 RepID=A0A7L5E8H2_9SPHI|nr:DUF892 family protein [Mucilaginibacter robiniae]QJD97173.1 DUF892 family protein [Mucilaginibacter robiniae]